MGKITVKHYLNTNLKPYLINGERYFSIYALVTANRQNTKVKSKAFNEYYTEKDFAELTSPDNLEDAETIKHEETTIINIVNLLVQEFESFDTTLFAAVYSYYQNIYVFELDFNHCFNQWDKKNLKGKIDLLFQKEKNKMGIGIDQFFTEPFSLKENQSKGMSIFTWFTPKTQKKLSDFLTLNKCKYDINRSIEILNKLVFYACFDRLNWIFKGTKKFSGLCEKYDNFIITEKNMIPYLLELSLQE